MSTIRVLQYIVLNIVNIDNISNQVTLEVKINDDLQGIITGNIAYKEHVVHTVHVRATLINTDNDAIQVSEY